MQKKISVIMSVYGRPEFIKKTINSVLQQTYKNFEFIIINDGSKNKLVNKKLNIFAKKDKRIKIITNKTNIGLTKSLNKGIKFANGEYIARIDNGDICHKNRFKIQSDFLDKNKDYAIVGSFVNIINLSGEKIGKIEYPIKNNEIKRAIIRTNPFAHSTLMIKKDVLDKLGLYNKKFYYSQDYELILKIASKYNVANIPKYLVNYLFDTKGITTSAKTRKKQDWFALKARYLAITKYKYPAKNILGIILPFIEYCVPFIIKRNIIKKININIKGKKIIFKKLK